MPLQIIGFVMSLGAAIVIFTIRRWRANLALMGIVYAGIFLILLKTWPLEQAAIKLIGGWMATAVLGATPKHIEDDESAADAGGAFRFLVILLLLLVAWSSAEGTAAWLPNMTFEIAVSGVFLASSGLVRSGIVRGPLETVMSLLMGFAGFELLYAAVETSVLVTAMLAGANLAMALAAAYLSASIDPVEPEAQT